MTSTPDRTTALTAAGVIARAVAAVGVPQREVTVDGILAGNPDTVVTGIAVTMAATLDVLQRAVAHGANLVATHEPVFYDHANTAVATLEAEQDPVYLAKKSFIEEYDLVVWRTHDQWHDRRVDGVSEGTFHALGWAAPEPGRDPVARIAPTTLRDLAQHIAGSLGAGALRYVGDPAMPVTGVGVQLGFCGFERNHRLLQRADVDVLVIGEGHEWEIGEYVADASTLSEAGGPAKGLVVIGHYPSEEAGMSLFADWLGDLVPELPVTLVRAGDPYRML